MLINIDKKTNLLVEIGEKEPTQQLIQELRERYRVGRMLPTIDMSSFTKKSSLIVYGRTNRKSENSTGEQFGDT